MPEEVVCLEDVEQCMLLLFTLLLTTIIISDRENRGTFHQNLACSEASFKTTTRNVVSKLTKISVVVVVQLAGGIYLPLSFLTLCQSPRLPP